MRARTYLIFAAMLMFGDVAKSEAQDQMMDFNSAEDTREWWPVNDGVMGGRSSGGPTFEGGKLIFSGIINTNGGGFSSLRRSLRPDDLANVTSVTLRLKSDGRFYKLRFRTNVAYRGRLIAFQKPIPATNSGEWETVTLTLDNMDASLFGRRIMGADFIPADAIETGIILADGQDGPFRLEVDWIKFN